MGRDRVLWDRPTADHPQELGSAIKRALVQNPDFLRIGGLVVCCAGKGLIVAYTEPGHRGLLIEDCIAHHIEMALSAEQPMDSPNASAIVGVARATA